MAQASPLSRATTSSMNLHGRKRGASCFIADVEVQGSQAPDVWEVSGNGCLEQHQCGGKPL